MYPATNIAALKIRQSAITPPQKIRATSAVYTACTSLAALFSGLRVSGFLRATVEFG
jgi:hypothetical protein